MWEPSDVLIYLIHKLFTPKNKNPHKYFVSTANVEIRYGA